MLDTLKMQKISRVFFFYLECVYFIRLIEEMMLKKLRKNKKALQASKLNQFYVKAASKK